MNYSYSKKDQKIALIGCGYWGTIVAKTLIALRFKNIIIYDKNIKYTKILKKKFPQLIIEKKLEQILNDQSILNCFLITPPSKNFNLIKKFIKHNKNIFVEKPGTTKLKELIKLKKDISKSNSKFMMGYIYCYNDFIKKIKSVLDKKLLGKILYINFQRQNLGPIRNDVDVDYDLTSHDISILYNLFNKLPTLVSKKKYSFLKKKIPDISNLHLKIDKIQIDINNSWINPNKIRKITIIGSKRMLLFNELDIEKPLTIFNQYAKYPDLSYFDKKFLKSKAYIYYGKSYKLNTKKTYPLNNEIKHFFKSDKPLTDINFGIKILKFLKAV